MWNKPTIKQLAKLPKLYSTEDIKTGDKVVMMHFFIGNFDWYAVEFDPDTRQFFGYVNLGDDMCAEWGNFSLDELIGINRGGIEIDRDLHWDKTKAADIDTIAKAGGIF